MRATDDPPAHDLTQAHDPTPIHNPTPMHDPTLPNLSDAGAFFWKSGEFDQLRVAWCAACKQHLHPSMAICPSCLSGELTEAPLDGRAVVIAITENHQRWLPNRDPPYLIAYVSLLDAPDIRLTTNLVDCRLEDIAVGMQVQVRFRHCEDVWIPEFVPVKNAPHLDVTRFVAEPDVAAVTVLRASTKFEHKVSITGIGASRIGRRLGATPLALTVEACRAAIEDAGLSRADIDGLCCYPGTAGLPGLSSGGVRALEQVMQFRPVWHCGAPETPGQAGTVIDGMMAVASGLCRHVLCFTSFAQAVRPAINLAGASGRVSGEMAWQLPFGAASPANWIALYASNYMARFGVDRELLGWIAINARRHAAKNPAALYTQPLDMDAYLSARMISTPFGLYDCDVPCDGAIAVVISAVETAADSAQLPIWVEAVGTRITERQSWDQGTITHQPNVFGPAAHLWSRTELCPADVDVAELYDGFTFNVVSWLEGLRFCPVGEAASFIAQGTGITAGGALPLNTHGGHLSAGRTNGYGNLVEAVLQLRGSAGGRQIPEAAVAVVSLGGGIPAGCMLLRRT